MNIKCTECGNPENRRAVAAKQDRFRVALPAWHFWAVDSTGTMIQKLSACDDADDEPKPGYTVFCDWCDHEFIL